MTDGELGDIEITNHWRMQGTALLGGPPPLSGDLVVSQPGREAQSEPGEGEEEQK